MIADYTTPTLSYTARFVQEAHRGQRYGDWPNPDGTIGDPYVTHVRDVAARLRRHGAHAVMAGLLHHVVEDTAVTLQLLTDLDYPPQVVTAVDAVTRRDGEEYDDLIARAAADPLGCLVNLADNHSNVENLSFLVDRRRRHRLTRKYLRARRTLDSAYRALLVAPDFDCARFGPPVPVGETW